jgi:hypothetical protein
VGVDHRRERVDQHEVVAAFELLPQLVGSDRP